MREWYRSPLATACVRPEDGSSSLRFRPAMSSTQPPSRSPPVRDGGLDWLRALAAIMVVAIHVSAPGVLAHGRIDAWSWTAANLVDSLSRASVPVFFMLAGIGLLRDADGDPWALLRRRLGRVLVPFLVAHLLWSGTILEPLRFVGTLATAHVHYHLWFFYPLIALYVLAPVLVTLWRHAPTRDIDRLLLVWAAAAVVAPTLLRVATGSVPAVAQVLLYGGYALLGARLWLSDVRVPRRVCWAVFLAASTAVFVLTEVLSAAAVRPVTWVYAYDTPFVAAAATALVLAFKGLPAGRFVTAVSVSSLGIYLVHPLFIDMLARHGQGWGLRGLLSGSACLALVILASFLLERLLARVPGLRLAVGR